MSIEIIKPSGGGITSLNTLTASTQLLAVGTTGTDFAISSSVDTHTFNLPTASAANRGALSSADWTTFNSKGNGTVTSVQALTLGTTGTDLSSTVANGNTVPVITLNVPTASAANRGVLSATDWSTFNDKADKLITTNRQTASYTLVIGDANKLVEMNVATANNLTVPLNSSVAYSIGTQILLAQYGAGQTTVVATGGVTIRSSGGKLKLNAQYSGATLIKIATDEWYLFGDITT